MLTRSSPALGTLWQQPRRSTARRAVLQVHLWLGVLLGLYTVVIGLTGSLLVFRPEIERAQRPQLYRHTGPAMHTALSLDRLLPAVRQQHPEEPLLGIDNLDRPSEPAIVYLAAPADNQRMVYVDQGSGAILGDVLRYSGWLGTCANLHVYLMAGTVGYTVNGACAVAFLAMCLTGWLLWWPGIRRLGRGLRVHWGTGARRTNWKRLNWDLHAVGGFWTNPLLILVIATGILFVFPRPVLGGLAVLSGHGAGAGKAWLAPPTADLKPHGAALAADQALALATAQLNRVTGSANGYRIRYLALPQPGSDMFEAIAYRPGSADYAMPIHLYLGAHADATAGRLLGTADARALPAGLRWSTYAYAVHFGTFGGMASRVAWVLLGLMPAALWATGLLLWWNRALRPALARQRGAAKGV